MLKDGEYAQSGVLIARNPDDHCQSRLGAEAALLFISVLESLLTWLNISVISYCFETHLNA